MTRLPPEIPEDASSEEGLDTGGLTDIIVIEYSGM